MKLKNRIITILIICLLVFPTLSLAGRFKVTKVYDGDTIMAEGHDIIIYVLLAGIDVKLDRLYSKYTKEPIKPSKEAGKKGLQTRLFNNIKKYIDDSSK